MLAEKRTICTLTMKGGSSSTLIMRFRMKSWNYIGERAICKQEPVTYQMAANSNSAISLTKKLTILYGQTLNIMQRTANTQFHHTIVAIAIKSNFCLFKCRLRQLAMRKYCGRLNQNDLFNSESLSLKIYGEKCGKKACALNWHQTLKLSHFKNVIVLARVLLPGIYDDDFIHISHTSTISLQQNQSSYLDVAWQDTNILQRVDTSLRLNGKQYRIFTDYIESTMYTWTEAEDICTHHRGHLPSISSQSDVQDLVDIILRAAWTRPIRMIYIGLKVSSQ